MEPDPTGFNTIEKEKIINHNFYNYLKQITLYYVRQSQYVTKIFL
jgi:hypothetical protein